MSAAVSCAHDRWLGSSIIARTIAEAIGDDAASARAWFTEPSAELLHVCSLAGQQIKAVQRFVSDLLARFDAGDCDTVESFIGRVVETANKRAPSPQKPLRHPESTGEYYPEEQVSRPALRESTTAPELERVPKPPRVPKPKPVPRIAKPKPMRVAKPQRCLAHNGEVRTISEWSKLTGIPCSVIRGRIASGWNTAKALSDSRRGNRNLTFNGKTLSVTEWAKSLGLRRNAIQSRLDRGWPVERILSEPSRESRVLITHNGETLCITDWSKRTGLAHHVISCRLRSGWSVARALTTPKEDRRTKGNRGVVENFGEGRPDRWGSSAQETTELEVFS